MACVFLNTIKSACLGIRKCGAVYLSLNWLMKMEEYVPTSQFRPFIKAYRIIESRDGITNRVLPNTSFAMAFRLRGEISYINGNGKTVLPTVTFSGLRKTVRLINYGQNSATLMVLFKEQGISSFFKQPLHELFEQSVSLNYYLPPSEVSFIAEHLAGIEDNRSKIMFIEQFLLSKLLCHNPDTLVSEAIAKIHSAKGNIRIKELANHLYISQDAFEKRFRKITGATPKQFSYLVKMDAIIRQSAEMRSFFAIAFESGYHDQPHFNKDFKIFTGQTPTDFFKSSSYW